MLHFLQNTRAVLFGVGITVIISLGVFALAYLGINKEEVIKEDAPISTSSPIENSSEIRIKKEDKKKIKKHDPILPQFDVVRVAKDGSAVLAGRAAPGSQVTIFTENQVIGNIKTNSKGEWVLVRETPFKPGSIELRLQSKNGDGEIIEGDHVVVLQVAENIKKTQPLAILVSRETDGRVKILNEPISDPSAKENNLIIKAIDYDDQGNMLVSGFADVGHLIRIYLNDKELGNSGVDETGRWTVRLDDSLPPGSYKLRVDNIFNDQIRARVFLPFVRPVELTRKNGEEFVVVQRGNSLWRIARKELGSGGRYTVIYDANKHQVRDPDMIFPGQILAIPKKY